MSLHARLAVALTAVVGVLALGAAMASASTDFTWSGGALPASNWSNGQNWVGGSAPSGSVGTLTFPALTPPSGATSQPSTDDLANLSANQISINVGGTPYVIGTTGGQLALGSGGLDAWSSGDTPVRDEIDLPVTLESPQTWTIYGGYESGGLRLDGSLSGPGNALQIALDDWGVLELGVASDSVTHGDNEVGNITAAGAGDWNYGVNAYANGALAVDPGVSLDATDGNTIQLNYAGLYGAGTVGSVSSLGGVITAGDPLGVLTVNGSVTLDASSALQFRIADTGSTAGTDYSQLRASGNVDLGGAYLDIKGAPTNPDCPSLTAGSVDTLLTTTGTLTGTFTTIPNDTAVPNGGVVTLDCSTGSVPPQVEINYTPHAVTATVVPIPTTTTLTASPTSVGIGQAVTLTASVSAPAGLPTPAGTVEFSDVSGAISGCGAVPVGPSGTASCTTSTIPYGVNAVTATFDPTNRVVDSASTSSTGPAAVWVAVNGPPVTPPPPQQLVLYQTLVSITGNGNVTAVGSNGVVTPVANCPEQCSGETTEVPVTLTATPASGWTFKGWGGACSGTGACTTDGQAEIQNVTASFTAPPAASPPPPPTPTITSLTIKHTTATVRLKRPRTATGLKCALVRDPTTKHQPPPKPLYSSCTTSKIYRHLHTHTSYTLYVRAVSAGGHSKAVSRRFTINS